jgi:hypothetical protein
MGMTARVVSELFSVCMGDVTKLLEETGSVIYVQEDNNLHLLVDFMTV